MNCPKCGRVGDCAGVKTLQRLWDSDNKEYLRKCRCTECKSVFYTIEYEIECDDVIRRKFDELLPVNSSKKRFYVYRESKAAMQKIQRRGSK